MYEMFLGPLTSAKSWQTNGVIGVYRFLNRVWDLVTGSVLAKKEKKSEKIKMTKESQEKLKELINHLEITRQRTIKKVTEDIEHFRFNTAISTLMEYLNHLEEIPKEKIDKKHLETLILLLSPFAPHLCEELASSYLGFKKPLLKTKWPTYKPDVLKENQIVIVVQVNGKTRATLKVKKGLSQKEVEKQSLPLIKKYLNQKIKRIVFVPDKIINFVF
jgi:leucyl-tRNA synthetase